MYTIIYCWPTARTNYIILLTHNKHTPPHKGASMCWICSQWSLVLKPGYCFGERKRQKSEGNASKKCVTALCLKSNSVYTIQGINPARRICLVHMQWVTLGSMRLCTTGYAQQAMHNTKSQLHLAIHCVLFKVLRVYKDLFELEVDVYGV